MKTIAKITFAIGILCLFAFAQTAKPKAAVYIKGNPEGRDALRMAVNTFLIKSQKYQMIAVDAIDVVAKEQNRQRGGSVSNEDIALLGRDAGAQYVCVVERSELDGTSYVSTSIVSVQSKIAELSEMSELPRGERIIDLIERQINTMLGIYIPEPEPEYEPEYTPPKKAKPIPPPVEESYSASSYTEHQDEDYYASTEWHYTPWQYSPAFGIGLPFMMNSIDNLYSSLGFQYFMNVEFSKPSVSFFRLGLNLDLGVVGAGKMLDALKQKNPEIDSVNSPGFVFFIKTGAFVRLYPADFIYLSGGANYGGYGGVEGQTPTGEKASINGTSAVVFPFGIGFVLSGDNDVDFLIDVQYNIAKLKNGIGGYWSFNIGGKWKQKSFD